MHIVACKSSAAVPGLSIMLAQFFRAALVLFLLPRPYSNAPSRNLLANNRLLTILFMLMISANNLRAFFSRLRMFLPLRRFALCLLLLGSASLSPQRNVQLFSHLNRSSNRLSRYASLDVELHVVLFPRTATWVYSSLSVGEAYRYTHVPPQSV